MEIFILIIAAVITLTPLRAVDGKIFKDLEKESLPQMAAVKRRSVKTLYIEQKLDNFNESDIRIWRMRYFADAKFYKPGGPLFIYVGDESPILHQFIDSRSHLYQLAKEHNGYLFCTEHRFYGKSQPVADLASENIKYLNAAQALADLAHFVRTMKETYDGMENSKVILAGCSYGASLVTWFKKLYPDLATGGWASSAPLLAKVDFFDYKELVGQAIKQFGGDDCYNRISNGITELESMLANKRADEVKSMLKLCDSFNENNNLDVSTLFSYISSFFGEAVELNEYAYHKTQLDCDKIMQGSSDIAGLANYIVDKLNCSNCTDMTYNSYLKRFMKSTLNKSIQRAAFYRNCNEFGWFLTSSSRNQPFGSRPSLDYFITLCADTFGSKFTREYIEKKVLETNKLFGGLEPNVENIYWTEGGLNPWRTLGIMNQQLATNLPYVSYCRDMDAITPFDFPELMASKKKFAALVREWLTK